MRQRPDFDDREVIETSRSASVSRRKAAASVMAHPQHIGDAHGSLGLADAKQIGR